MARSAGIDLSPGSSALVVLDDRGGVPFFQHFQEPDVKVDLLARIRMAERVHEAIIRHQLDIVAIEDYDLNPTQQVGYQIAEVAGILKSRLIEQGYPLVLVHPTRLKAYVDRRRGVTKNDVIAWAEAEGFSLPPKSPGKPGLYKRQREDIADAYVCSRIAADVHMHLYEGHPPKKGDMFLDPDIGLVFGSRQIFNSQIMETLDAPS